MVQAVGAAERAGEVDQVAAPAGPPQVCHAQPGVQARWHALIYLATVHPSNERALTMTSLALGDPVQVGLRIVRLLRHQRRQHHRRQRRTDHRCGDRRVDFGITQADQAPSPDEIVRKSIEAIISEVTLTEVGDGIRAEVSPEKRRAAEQEIQDAREAYASRWPVADRCFGQGDQRSHRRWHSATRQDLWGRRMTRFLLSIDEQSARNAADYDEVFLWTRTTQSTFGGSLTPHLTAFGPVRQANIDFVRLALGVFAADRSVSRQAGGSNWNARNLALTVEVGEPGPWLAAADELSTTIGFLTGDHWTFDFLRAIPDPAPPLASDVPAPNRVVLLSGGADSATGALLSALDLAEDQTQLLVSHFSAPSISPFQRNLVKEINRLAPQQDSLHRQINLNRTAKRLDGTTFRSEPSSRSRSLLFLALGLASAEQAGTPLLIPENGFASLNPPLGPERRGALSTHTTHPRFLREIQAILSSVGAHGLIENPFEALTKGEMFAQLAERVGKDKASVYLSATNSCAHTDARYSGGPPGSSCGVCFGCLVRRASFIAAGIVDATDYLCNDQTDRFEAFVRSKSVVEAMRDFAADDPKPRVVMAMSLPPTIPRRTRSTCVGAA